VKLNVTPISTISVPSDEIFLSRWIGRLSHCGRYAKASVIRSEKSLGFCHLIGSWRAETEEVSPSPSVAMPHNYVSKRGCSTWGRMRRRWSGRRWRNVNLLNEFLHARCSPIIGICLRVLAEVTSKHPVPSVVPPYALFSVTADEQLKRIASHEKHNNLHHWCDLREIPRAAPININ